MHQAASLLISLITFTPQPANKNEVILWEWVGPEDAYIKSGLVGHIFIQVGVEFLK